MCITFPVLCKPSLSLPPSPSLSLPPFLSHRCQAPPQACPEGLLPNSLKQRTRPPSFTDLPQEVLLKVLRHLSPRDLCIVAQVNNTLAQATMDGLLWQHVHPVRWFHGHWKFYKPSKGDDGDCDDRFDDGLLASSCSCVGDNWSGMYGD